MSDADRPGAGDASDAVSPAIRSSSGDRTDCAQGGVKGSAGSWWAVGAIVLLAICLRGFRLDHQSVWDDEAFSIVTSERDVPAMTARLVKDFVHPPLHYYVLHACFRVFDVGSLQARAPSFVFGVLLVAWMFLLGRRMFDARAGILAALLMAVSQLGVMYSQEARPYALMMWLIVVATHLFWVAVQDRRASAWWAFVIVGLLATYTHYYAGLSVGVLYGLALLHRRRYALGAWWLPGGIVASIVLYAPWLASGIFGRSDTERIDPGDRPWFSVDAGSAFRAINDYSNGRLFGVEAGTARWTFLIAGGLFVGFAFAALARRRDREGLAPGLPWIVVAAALGGYGAFVGDYVYAIVVPGLVLLAPPMLGRRRRLGVRADGVGRSRAWTAAWVALIGASIAAGWRVAPAWAMMAAGALLLAPWTLFRAASGAADAVSDEGAAEGEAAGPAREVHPPSLLRRREAAMTCALLFGLPLLVILGVNLIGVQYNVRYTLPCLAPYYLLVARGLTLLRPRWMHAVALVLVVAYSGVALRANYFIPYKENYRDGLAWLSERCGPQDAVIFAPWGRVPREWKIYGYDEGHPGLKTTDVQSVIRDRRPPVVWLVSYHRVQDAARESRAMRERLARVYRRTDGATFHWIDVDRFEARPR